MGNCASRLNSPVVDSPPTANWKALAAAAASTDSSCSEKDMPCINGNCAAGILESLALGEGSEHSEERERAPPKAVARDAAPTRSDKEKAAAGILAEPLQQHLEAFTQLVKQVFGTPLAAVVVADQRLHPEPRPTGDTAACYWGQAPSWALVSDSPALLVVEDAQQAARQAPLTVAPARCVWFQGAAQAEGVVRFFASAPLLSKDGGSCYGTLCTADVRPRCFTTEQYQMLCRFADICTHELEHELALRLERQSADKRLCQALEGLQEGIALVDLSSPGWHMWYANDAFRAAAGLPHLLEGSSPGACHEGEHPDEHPDEPHAAFWAMFGHVSDGGGIHKAAVAALAAGEAFTLYVQPYHCVANSAGQQPLLKVLFQPASSEQGRGGGGDCPDAALARAYNGCITKSATPEAGGAAHYFAIVQPTPQQRRQRAAAPSQATPTSLSATSSLAGGLPTGDSLLAFEGSPPIGSASASLKQELVPGDAAGVLPSFFAMRPEVMNEVVLGPLVGSGSSGRCYRASWQGGRVAVKIIDCRFDQHAAVGDGTLSSATSMQEEGLVGSQKPAAEAALVEALLARSLSHPHILSTYCHAVSRKQLHFSGEWHQQVWIIQEFCSRGSLMGAIDKGLLQLPGGGPNLPAILMAAQEIAGAVLYLHQHGIVHGDLTPGNVLLTSSSRDSRRWVCKVGDFGLAQIIHHDEVQSDCFGTLTHAAPELVRDGALTRSCDVYSFGVVLLEMVQLRRAWKGMSFMQIFSAVSAGNLPFVIPKDCPEGLASLLRRCLSPEPKQRPTLEVVLQELQELVKALPRAADVAQQQAPVSVRGPDGAAQQAAPRAVSPFAAQAAAAGPTPLSTIYEPGADQ